MSEDRSAMIEKPQVMVVDDDLEMCGYLRTLLGSRGYSALTITNADEGVRRFHAERPAAVLLDVVMPGSMDGLAALAAFKKIDKEVPVIVISGQGRTSTVVSAMRLGANDFVCKPFADEELEMVLRNALKHRQLSREVASLREQLKEQSKHRMLLGNSERMAEVRDLIARVSDTDVSVLICGESGTGKELVARALHAASHRKTKPFVKVNCAALPMELLESELFGFEKGAFTGAIQHKPGKFEFANQGTMFLDEIGELSTPLQAKLLQVLQDREFSRLGGRADVHVDVRVIAATNRDLEQAVRDGAFREDLFFRLNLVTIAVPPLRERRDEIPLLTDHFLKKYAVQFNKPVLPVSQELLRLFMEAEWPGNVRQLENLIKRMVVLGTEGPIVKDLQQPPPAMPLRPWVGSLPGAPLRARNLGTLEPRNVGTSDPRNIGIAVAESAPYSPAAAAAVAAAAAGPSCSLKDIARSAARGAERELILRMLTRTRWNRKEAAEMLGISYKALLYKIKENGLDRAS